MNKKTQLGFIHRFIPSNKNQAGAKGKIRSTTILLLHGTGGNEEDLIPLAQRNSSRRQLYLVLEVKFWRTGCLASLDE